MAGSYYRNPYKDLRRIGRVALVEVAGTSDDSQIAAAVVSNSKQYGETVMQKVLAFAENQVPGRLRDAGIFSEFY
jgi:hypothetical protein